MTRRDVHSWWWRVRTFDWGFMFAIVGLIVSSFAAGILFAAIMVHYRLVGA